MLLKIKMSAVQADIVRLNATMIGQLETEISMYKSESLKQRKIVQHLEKVIVHTAVAE